MPARFPIHLIFLFTICCALHGTAQNGQTVIKTKVQDLIERKAEYHRLTNGTREGYRIKIHFGVEREKAAEVRTKFTTEFNDLSTYEEYQQPNWVVLVGDFSTKLEAFEMLKQIQAAFPNAFIVKGRINPR